MKICRTLDELIQWRKEQTQSVGFVPTMGALHQGHRSLMQASKKTADLLVVSIFVNPTQFLEGEDFESYPKKEASDEEICRRVGVDCLFLPTKEMMYEKDELTVLAPSVRSFTLEGASRPGHFDGVLQIVLKLLNLTQADFAFFGKKDAQQLSMIQHMVDRLFLPVEIIAVETVREDDGLALSSRNVYLDKQHRKKALLLSQALKVASNLILEKEYKTSLLINAMTDIFNGVTDVKVEYISVVNRAFSQIETVELQNTIIVLAVRVGTTRLIDNLWI